jgi:hypothetical protein
MNIQEMNKWEKCRKPTPREFNQTQQKLAETKISRAERSQQLIEAENRQPR